MCNKVLIKRIVCFLTLLCILSLNDIAFAAGPVHGAKAAAMGTAFDAVADDPSAILFNPGGLTQIKTSAAYFGVTAVKPTTTYTSPSGESETTGSRVFFPPHLYVASRLGADDFAFGLGLYSPFGIGGRKWSTTGLTRYQSTESTISTFSVNPTVAWQVLPHLSLAGGVDYMRAEVGIKRMIDQSALGASDAESKLKADGGGWGYNLGMLLFVGEDVRIGLAYRSKITVKYNGAADYATPVSTTSHFPEIYSFGAAYKPNAHLVLDADVELVRWSSFDRMDLEVQQQAPPFITNSSIPLDWKDSRQYKIGVEYQMGERLFLRSGYAYIKNPVPEHTLEPGNPDADQQYFSIGTGYRFSRLWIDWFYMLGLYRDRHVQNGILSGEYENRAQMAGLSAGVPF